MADANAKTSSFIELVLDLSGRVRTSDMAEMRAEEAATVLQAYAAAHPEKRLTFDGQALVAAAPTAPPAPAPAPEPVFEPQAVQPASSWEFDDNMAAPLAPATSEPAYGAAGSLEAIVPEVTPSAYGVPAETAADSSYGVPMPAEPLYIPATSESDPFAATPEWGAAPQGEGVEWEAPQAAPITDWPAPQSPAEEWPAPAAAEVRAPAMDAGLGEPVSAEGESAEASDFFEFPALTEEVPTKRFSRRTMIIVAAAVVVVLVVAAVAYLYVSGVFTPAS